MKIQLHKIAQSSPDDVSGIEALIRDKKLDPSHVIAVMGKTEGNGCVNDFTRGFTTQTLKNFFAKKLGEAVSKKIVYVMSGGTEGILSPHITIITREKSNAKPTGGLAVGIGRTRNFIPSEIGTMTMVKEVARAVTEILKEFEIEAKDTHFVQIKCPLLTAEKRLNNKVKTEDSYKSMAYSRGASALGIAVALGELKISDIKESDICSNYSLYSSIASTSAGVELDNCEIIVFGNSKKSNSEFMISHDVMKNVLDVDAISRALKKIGGSVKKVYTIFAKAEADPSGKVLGNRHTMIDDSDVSHTRMARAVVGAALASVVQDTMIYVSGGSEHQGPSGGGPLAVVVKKSV